MYHCPRMMITLILVTLLLWVSSSVSVAADNAADVGGCNTITNHNIYDDPDPDRVVNIPKYDGCICWKHYSGYLNATDDHKLFYWYHEAVNTNDLETTNTKPLVLWLNGGPGCSSLGGMFTELGPFVVKDSDLNVELNPYSFNKVANIIFIEQPAGVGFSYPNVPADDKSTAKDTVAALRYFLKYKHPELISNEFYVMGESYGGHYVSNTVKQIQETNNQIMLEASNGDNNEPIINIKGFAVGNGYTDWKLDFNANVPNGRYHALTSQSLFEKAEKACDGDYARCFWPRPDIDCPEECGQAVYDATVDAEDGTIDIYDIYNDVCINPDQARIETQSSTFLKYRQVARLNSLIKKNGKLSEELDATDPAAMNSRRDLRATISPIYPTCVDTYTEKYLNLPKVQKAIHVKPETIPNGVWKDCGNVNYNFNYDSELDNYRQWIKDGNLKILIYNGDADYILSHMGNNAWINQGLKLNKTKDGEWTKWYGSNDKQVAGYYETYQTSGIPLTFLTVKGAGHMVPRDRPKHALDMFTMFINNNGNGGNYDKYNPTQKEATGKEEDEVEAEPSLCTK